MSDKAAMSREIPHLRGLLASKSKRIGQLEYMVGETKEIASSEYEKLRAENEQMKANFMAKLKDKERDSECDIDIYIIILDPDDDDRRPCVCM